MHYFAAVVALCAVLLYADRSGWLHAAGAQRTVWAGLTRLANTLVLVSVALAFLDLAHEGAPFAGRHWLVLGALLLLVIGHLGLRHKDPT